MVEEVRYAMNPMKLGKENGSSVEFFKAGGDKCLKSFTNIFNDILFKDKLRQECMLSSLVPIFKGKVDPLNPNSYREIKLLLNCAKSFWMRVCVRGYILIKCNMGLCQGKGLLNDVFVLRSFEKNSEPKIRCFL